jgi:Domain of unknown function (DUF3841)
MVDRAMASIRLWTFQRVTILDALRRDDPYRARWDFTPMNWRVAYRWMASQLSKRVGHIYQSPPVWCWHSCNGKEGAPPTVGTARLLLSDYDFEQGMVMLILSVPEELTLLSSYFGWNQLLEHVIVHRSLPRSRRRRRRMFEATLLKHGSDDIQAAIPHLRSEWIESTTKLVIAARGWDELL